MSPAAATGAASAAVRWLGGLEAYAIASAEFAVVVVVAALVGVLVGGMLVALEAGAARLARARRRADGRPR